MMKHLFSPLSILLLLTVFAPYAAQAQTTYTWTGAAPGDNLWATPENWSPNGVPGAEDVAIIESGTADVETPVTVGALTLGSEVDEGSAAATLGGTADVTVAGPLRWIGGGRFTGSGTVTGGPGSTIEPQVGGLSWTVMSLTGRTVVLGDVGPVAFSGQGVSSIGIDTGGVLELSGGLAASGPEEAELRFSGDNSGTLRTGGALSLDGGTLRFQFVAVESETELSVFAPATMILTGPVASRGTLGGDGDLTITNGNLFTNTGAIAPALSGASGIFPTVVTSSALPIGTEGRLEIELGGTEPGTGYDRLDVAGAVELEGELAVSLINGFAPELGQTFEVMTFTSRTGEFDTLTGSSLGNGLGLTPSYTDTSVLLTVVEDGNMPPIAVDDAATTTESVAVTIDVLSNDSDPDEDVLSIAMVGSPVNGTVEIVQGQVRYTPALGFTGIDDFTYTVSDGNGGEDDGFVTVTVLEATSGVVTLTSPSLETLGGQFGRSLAAVPDTDGDGRDDLLVGAPLEDGEFPDAGQAYLFSGATGAVLRTLVSPNPEDSGFFGFTVAGVPDADGDGRGDLLIGAILEDNESQDAGRAYLFSGSTGLLLQTLESPNFVQSGLFSSALAGVPDVDGDGRGDLLVGAPSENRGAENAGAAYLFSGGTGALLRTLESPNPELDGQFGISVAGVVDVDGDSRRDLVIGAFREDGGAQDAGRVYLFSGGTGALLQTLVSPNPEVDGQFGVAVAGSDDILGAGFDGRSGVQGSILVGATFETNGQVTAGKAYLFDGAGGTLLRTMDSPSPEDGGNFGVSVSDVPDVNGDGLSDFVIGAFREDGGAQDAGRAYLYDGATGVLLRTLVSPTPQPEGFFGDTVVGVSDVDGDGRGDLLVSAPFEDPGEVADAGRAYLFSGSTGGGEVVVTVSSPAAPTAGSDFDFGISVEGFSATAAELRYRPTGAPAFGTMPLAMDLDAYAGTIPGADVTLRGIDYYIVLTDGESTVTFPQLDPELRPLRLRVIVPQQVAGVELPPNAQYRMVSVPAVLDDPDPFAVFRDDYGTYGETSWRLLRWVPGLEQYAELAPPDSLDRPVIETPVVPGEAFWLAAYADAPFDIDNARSVDASEPVTVVLQPGWNQIGNPFAFPVAWDAVLGSDLVQPPVLYGEAEAGAGAEYLQNQLVLDPWSGYFVFNPELEPIFLEIPPIEALDEGRSASRGVAAADGYEIRLRAEVPERDLRDTQNVFGFAEGAEVARLARAEPPPIGPHLRLSAVEDGRRLAHSFRPAGTDGADWELELSVTADVLAAGPVSVHVALEEVGGRPTGYALWVLDLDGAAPLTLLEGAFEITLSPAHPVRRLRLIAGTEAYAEAARQDIPLIPVEFALAPAYPNPFAGAATLAYQLPAQADVVLDVFDLLGRRVAVLADGVQEAGRYSVRWDGTVAGAPAANGVYVYRLRAGSFTATHKMVLLR